MPMIIPDSFKTRPLPQPENCITFPFLIDGYGVIKDRNDWRMFCRRYEQLRSAYNQLVLITDEVQGVSHGL